MSVPYDDFCTRVLEFAQAKSMKMENGYVGTEHLLWGILEAEGELSKILQERSIDIEQIFKGLSNSMEDYSGLSREMGPRTPRLRGILGNAQQLALQLMEPGLNEQILVRALLSGGRSTAVRMLESLNVNCDELTQEIESRKRKEIKERASWLIQEPKPITGQPIPRQHYPLQGPFFHFGQGPGPLSPQEAPKIGGQEPQESASPFGRDLSRLALSKKLNPCIGREKEISEICLCLRRATSSNAILVGEKGVGKNSVIEGLALQIAEGKAPGNLKGTKIIEISGSKLFQSLGSSKEAEDSFRVTIQKSPFPGTIFFLDGVMELLDEERIPWPVLNAINLIKEKIDDGAIRAIITSNPKTYEKRITGDPVLSKHCQKIEIQELPRESALLALKSMQERFESHHGVEITDEHLSMILEFSTEYLKDNVLPGKAIDLLDEACVLAGARKVSTEKTEISEQDIIEATAKKSGLPREKISKQADKFRNMEDELKKKIIGQDDAIRVVCDRIKLFMTGLHEEHRPLGVLFFAGPTGVGKTELAKVVAAYLFGSESHFYRFDMSEYSHSHEVSRLVGAPPGYVGFEEEGQLTGRVKSDPYCVILLDEVEKAHSRIFDTFLQVFDAGRLTDGKGNTVDFRNTLIIMTSNLGGDLWESERALGFRHKEDKMTEQVRKEKMTALLKERFSPEFVNRINEIVLFNALTEENIRAITILVIGEWNEKIRKYGVRLSIADNLLEHLSREGYSREFGVRNLKRTIENILIVPLSKKLLEGTFSQGDAIIAGLSGGNLELRIEPAGQ